MSVPSSIITPDARCLLAAAAPRELAAVGAAFDHDLSRVTHHDPVTLDDKFDAVLTGVGKAAASATVARVLATHTYANVISVGVAGSLPIDDPPEIGSTITATRSLFADEGLRRHGGLFTPITELGFAPFKSGDAIDHDPTLTDLLKRISDHAGLIATVSGCSANNQEAELLAKRTLAAAEAMEGAAVALAAQRADRSIRTGEIRSISNTTGEREHQTWDLDAALGSLTVALTALKCDV